MTFNQETVELILKIVLFISLALCIGSFCKYLADYKIIQAQIAKIKGDIFEYDRIRRTQMKKDIETDKSIFNVKTDKEIPFLSKLYKKIELTGITLKIPAFSESIFLFLAILVGIILSVVVWCLSSSLVGMVFFVVYLFAVWYGLGIVIYYRKQNVDKQLLQFTNSAASASRQYSNVIDIIGAVYDQFEGAFREALEACYVEAKTTNDTEMAFTHFKNKFDSQQLGFVMDNFVMCSSSTGDYYTVANDLSKTVAIYSTSHEKKAVTLRNAKMNVTIMFVIAFVIMYSLGGFFGGGLDVLFHTTVGNLLLIAMVFIFLLGMNIKAN